jgi:sec-independent protein translocase protein TatB
MFDVGMLELFLVAVVALLVVGPERLPKLARTAGMWLGRGRRFVTSVKDDIDREIKADELRAILEKQKRNNPMHEIVEDTRKTFDDIKAKTESAIDPQDKKAASDNKQ